MSIKYKGRPQWLKICALNRVLKERHVKGKQQVLARRLRLVCDVPEQLYE